MEQVSIVLSSTVISAVITVIFNFLTNYKKNQIENITQERKNWRDNIRKLSSQISNANDINELLHIIDKLKVRINAFGITDPNDYKNDGHIWKIIRRFESIKSTHTVKEIEILKIQLIESLSCLLKYDWDRSKKEIQGNKTFVRFSCVYFICLVTYISYTLLNNANVELTVILCAIFIYLIAMAVFYCVDYFIVRYVINNTFIEIVTYFGSAGIVAYSFYGMMRIIGLTNDVIFKGFMIFPIFSFFIFFTMYCLQSGLNRMQYKSTIDKILQNKRKPCIVKLKRKAK